MILALSCLIVQSYASDNPLFRDIQRFKQRQALIEERLGSAKSEDGPKLFTIHASQSEALIAEGRLLFAKTVTRVLVSSDNVPVLLTLGPGQGFLSGLRLKATAHAGSVAERIEIQGKALLLGQGQVVPVNATGLDEEGALGIPAQVLSQKLIATLGSLGAGILSGLAGTQETGNASQRGVFQGLAQTSAEESKALLTDATRSKPILILEPGTPVTLLIESEVRIP